MAREALNISHIVENGLCLQCGTCVSICPDNVITLKRDRAENYVPAVNSNNCSRCGFCVEVCPGVQVDFKQLTNSTAAGRDYKWHPYTGEYVQAFQGYSQSNDIRRKASSGGIVPATLLHLLQTGEINGVLTVRIREKSPFDPEVFIATSPQELFDSMQSKYHPVPLNASLKDLFDKKGRYAVVGLPCHIHGLKKYLQLKNGDDRIYVSIGLFCGLNLRFDSLQYFASRAGESSQKLEKALYREGTWPGQLELQFTGNKTHTTDKNIVNHLFTIPRCLLCIDHTSELADISCGDAWLPDLINKNDEGWSVVITRSLRAQTIMDTLNKENVLQLEEVDISKVIESQQPMLYFKKKNSWLRLRLTKLLGKSIPEYNTDAREKSFSPLFLIGNIILIITVSLMKYPTVTKCIKHTPQVALHFYKALIINLLYKDKPIRKAARKLFGTYSAPLR